ncbi:angiopoietin-related protein 2-like [Toxorhynchites rutilus septentrionalis]|uniref:angiopoietin-related protein 2-like n=1 Tax=Toxorhynchites rutilus septentrionalis TaxID=329112 RepID=UPI00247AD70C|nr:angiopoietin-related protein 2-like [Toxorhynchites rutilus septentrionalis]
MRSIQGRKILVVICVLGAVSGFSLADVYYSPEQLFNNRMSSLQTTILKHLDERLDSFERRIERKLGQQLTAMQRATDNKWLEIDDKILVLKGVIQQNSGAYFSSCRYVPSEFSNVFMIRPSGVNTQPFMAYCEQNYLGGGWIVIHKRFDGSVDFNRNWAEYRDGFGELDGEHWMGLEKIHRITRTGQYELLVVLKDFDGDSKMALYDGFKVDDGGAKFKLFLERFVHGNLGDSLDVSKGARFSTYDQDNDQNPDGSCAQYYTSGWWFKNCMNANLNGPYRQHDKDNKTMNWFAFHNNLQGLKEASMMIREKVTVV